MVMARERDMERDRDDLVGEKMALIMASMMVRRVRRNMSQP